MKIMNFLYGAICVALAGNMLGACTNDDDVMTDSSTAKVPMTFTAGNSSTRTALGNDGKVVNWVKGDAIALYDGIDYNEFITQDEGTTASFVGEARPAESYVAFYPYASIIKDRSNGNNIVFNLPAEQTAVPGSFATGLVPSWAQTVEGSNVLQFHNLCALVKFTVSDDIAGEGTFILRGTNGESLAGSMTYTIGGNGEAMVNVDASSAEVKLNGKFEVGKNYYFVVAPAMLDNGLSVFYKNSKGTAFRRAGSNAVHFESGKIIDLGTLTLSEKFEEAIINVDFIDAVEESLLSSGYEKGMIQSERFERTAKFVKTVESDNSGAIFVRNADGTVTLNDVNRRIIEGISELTIQNSSNLSDLSGIEYFTNVTKLDCSSNNLTSLDLNGLTNLKELDCSYNQIASLDLNALNSLTTLVCTSNLIDSLDVRGLKNLEKLICGTLVLGSLEVSGLSNLTYLDCCHSPLPFLDLSGLSKLTYLNCSESYLNYLDLSDLENLITLNCASNYLSSLDVTTLKNLEYLNCAGNNLGSLDVSGLSTLKELFCTNCQLTSLNLNGLSVLTELNCNNNQLTSLDLSSSKALTNMDCSNNQLTSLNLSGLNSLTILSCSTNQLTSLNLSGLKCLNTLNCGGNNLSQLDIASNTSLYYLSCGYQSSNLILYLTSEQKSIWDRNWINSGSNSNVTPQVKD